MQGGFLPEAICNYLALICGGSYEQEIMSLPELASAFNFDAINSTGQSKYDVEKLRWINHKWINKLEIADLATRVRPVLVAAYPTAKNISEDTLIKLLGLLRTDIITLADAPKVFAFYFEKPKLDKENSKPLCNCALCHIYAKLYHNS